MSYDTQCHTLALAFLRDYDYLTVPERAAHAHKLAQDIQDAIETYLSVEKMDEREETRAEAAEQAKQDRANQYRSYYP